MNYDMKIKLKIHSIFNMGNVGKSIIKTQEYGIKILGKPNPN